MITVKKGRVIPLYPYFRIHKLTQPCQKLKVKPVELNECLFFITVCDKDMSEST